MKLARIPDTWGAFGFEHNGAGQTFATYMDNEGAMHSVRVADPLYRKSGQLSSMWRNGILVARGFLPKEACHVS